ncbi:ribonuclease domain-containing protein [Knoellia sp. Soil729]|uniref:ribonuclease domain-containing protein n=1 Tax=Knoellia sp. Soil729 TaxID=1736394 RepID=UPI0006FC54DE|nr:ribonuclease domain-containing protein [Knoellia sp. Soil729]KRE41884.1 guanyl-specific ribonuclease SA [Knoellia sp. Soil729]
MAHVSRPVTGARSSLTWLAPLLVIALVAGAWWLATRDSSTGSAANPGTRATATAGQDRTAYPSGSVANTPDSGLDTVAESKLPKEARAVLQLIRAGGPYRYDQDDKTFQNREGTLPPQKKGYYREYTVETPGSNDRGARRIIGGREGDRYYTDDHYDSFRQIQEGT